MKEETKRVNLFYKEKKTIAHKIYTRAFLVPYPINKEI